MTAHVVDGGHWPSTSPPLQQRLAPPPGFVPSKLSFGPHAMRNWAVVASILVESARLRLENGVVMTPANCWSGPVWLRHESAATAQAIRTASAPTESLVPGFKESSRKITTC